MTELMMRDIVRRAVLEDLGRGDITTEAVVPADATSAGMIIAKSPGTIAGMDVAEAVFCTIDDDIEFQREVSDGHQVQSREVIARVRGRTRTILGGERVALNFLQRMSGVATQTREVVEAVKPHGVRVVDTRKTTPGLRILEKYAVRVGGGFNHRFGLDDAILLKDNHIRAAGGIRPAIERCKSSIGHMVIIEVEASDLEQVREALRGGADVILLDNMDVDTMREAVRIIDGGAVVEASGSITPGNAVAVARTGVDVMSLGFLTHSFSSLDISLDLE